MYHLILDVQLHADFSYEKANNKKKHANEYKSELVETGKKTSVERTLTSKVITVFLNNPMWSSG